MDSKRTEERDEMSEFEALYKKMHTPLCKKIFTLVNDTEVAADIVQNIFFKYWVNRSRLIIHTSKEAYLFRACVNEAYNHIKSAKRTSGILHRLAAREEVSKNTTDEAIGFTETSGRIRHAIRNMPPVCQEVFLLSRYDEMNHEEISAYLNISINTVNNHIKKALQILKNHLLLVLLLSITTLPCLSKLSTF